MCYFMKKRIICIFKISLSQFTYHEKIIGINSANNNQDPKRKFNVILKKHIWIIMARG